METKLKKATFAGGCFWQLRYCLIKIFTRRRIITRITIAKIPMLLIVI